MNNINSVTVVSAYYKVPSKRTHDEYDTFIDNFLNNINCNLVIFTSSDLVKYFKNKIKNRLNIILVIKEFNDLEIYKKYNNIWDSQYLIDDQKNIRSKYCYIIWNSKLDFIKEAIELNYFNTNKFVWNDIGCIRNNDYINLLEFYPLYDNISNRKIDIILLNYSIDENKKYFKDEIHFSGAIFGGVIKVLLKFHKLYYEKFDEYLKNNQFIGCDQQMILSVYLQNKELFNAINPFIDNINENNLIIPNKNKDKWFYLYHYYSYIPNPLKTCLGLGESHEQMIPKKVNSEKYVIFRPDGRLGNAIFRYLACILFSIKNNQVYILESECPKLEEYNFYEGVDYIGNDIGIIQSDNMEHIKQSLYYNDNAIAFNSLGFYKNSIDFNNLKSNEYINSQNKLGLYVKNIITVNDNNFYNYIDKDLSNYNILMSGFFQFNNIYLENKIAIMKYIENYGNDHYIHTCTHGNQDLSDNHQKFSVKEVLTDIILEDSKIYDIAIHLRLGDFADKDDFIDYIYLEELFSSIDFNGMRTCFVVEKPKTEFDFNFLNKCVEWFQHKNIPINVESNSLIVDFNIMKNTKILACSMSTLSWCAAFFSKKIEKCIMPDYNFYDQNRKTFFKNPIDSTIFYKVKTTKKLSLKIIIITLKDYPERLPKLEDLLSKFKKINIEYELFYGVNGKNIEFTDTDDENIKLLTYNSDKCFYDKRVKPSENGLKKGEIGASWSHINVYKKLLNDEKYDNYLIFEDDVKLISDLDNLQYTLNNLPDNFDCLHLTITNCYSDSHLRNNSFLKNNKINDCFYTIHKQFFNRCTSYIVSKQGCKKILNYTNNFINTPPDDVLSKMFNETDNFNFYVPDKPLFIHNETIESQIHTNNELICSILTKN